MTTSTHFCDANQIMLDAAEAIGVDPQDEALGKAWAIAKEAEFDVGAIMATDDERSNGPRQ